MSRSLESTHSPYDEPCLALVGWPTIPISTHSITSVALDYALGLLATGTAAGWLYIWRLVPSECVGEVAPRVACVGEWSGNAAVFQCHFCRWANPGLFGTNFGKVLVSLHEDGLLRLWTVDDGRCLYAFPTISFLGVNALFAIPLLDSRYLLLAGKHVISIFDLWSRCPAIVLLFSPYPSDATTTTSLRCIPLVTVITAVAAENIDSKLTARTNSPFIPDIDVTIISVATNATPGFDPSPSFQSQHRTIISAVLSNGQICTWDVTLPLDKWDRKSVYASFIPPLGLPEDGLHRDLQHGKNGLAYFEKPIKKPGDPIQSKGFIFPEEFIPERSVLLVPPTSISSPNQDVFNIEVCRVSPRKLYELTGEVDA